MAQHSPSTHLQDICRLLSSTFKDLRSGDVIGADVEGSWTKSQGGDGAHHEAFTEELQKLVAEYNHRLTEADVVEKNIIQAQARAKAEEERALNVLKGDAGKDFHKMGLPSVASSFRWIVDNDLLRKNHLTCPDDYITDKLPVTRAPKGKPEPGYVKETFSFKQRVFSDSRDQMTEHLQKISGRLPDVSLSTLTLPSTPDSQHQSKRTSKKSSASQKAAWKGSKGKAEREEERAYLAKLEKRQNFLKNPRFFPPNALRGGKSLVMSQEQVEQIISRREAESNTGDTSFVPVFLANPPTVLFSDYEVGQAYEAVATDGPVLQDPFGIYPAVFELAPGQSTAVEVVFFPSLPEFSQQTYTIACDNCQVNDVTVTGVGQLIALELLHVTGGESSPEPGEVTDVTAQHLIRFDPQNPHTTTEKNLVIRNSTHVELPFYWQIIKPNLQPMMSGESAHFVTLEYNRETESAFSLSPEQGVLLPHADHDFTLTYTPQELKIYHSVIQLVLRDIPESPSLVKERMLQNIPEFTAEDVIALDIEVKGSTEPFQLLLEPYAIIIPGESFLGVNVRRTFKMWNNSKSLIKYTWEKITSCVIMEVEPLTGAIDMNRCCEFELMMTGIRPGCVSHNLQCQIEHSPEPVVLHVEAAFKGPLLHISIPSLHLGLIKPGESVVGTFEIQNLCQLPARWRMQESQVCLAERSEEVSPFTIQPSAEEIPPLGVCRVSVQYTSLLCQRLHTVLELEVENGERSYLPVSVEVQTPQACLISSNLVFTEIYTGIPVKATSKLFNQTRLPAKYSWGKQLIGCQAALCSATISPAGGILEPNEEKEFCIELTANITGELKGLALSCSIEDTAEPLVLSISGEVKGLHVAYSVPCEGGGASSSGYLVKRRGPIAKHAAEKAQSEFAAAMLSHGKGVAFHIQPSSGTLQAFQQLIIEITAYNNMWGEYRDDLVCKVGDLQPTLIPMRMTVKGCPIFLQMTGPQTQRPIIRFGAHVSGGCPVFRSVQLNNPTPFDIRLDWETYNQEKDDKKLLDLLMFFGEPFPPKDIAKNETAPTDSNSEIVLGLEQPSVPRGSIYPALQTTDECSNTESEEEEIITQEATTKKIVSVLIRPHEGVPADNPYSVTPRQIVLTESVLTQSLKLINCTKVPLYFRLLLSAPFSLAGTDLKTSHREGEETEQQPQLVLYPQQNMLVKVSFHTTLELLTYQHSPDTQIIPGFQVLQYESGERKLNFSQNLIIEYSNGSTQLVPLTAYLTVPVLELSCTTIDFKTCFVAQTKTEHVFLCNRSGCRTYWTALLDQQERHDDLEVFSVSPANGILEAREGEQPTKDMLHITFTARSNTEYRTILTVTGMLGEKPCKLQIRGQGTHDGKYEDMYLI
ncbi:UNVERIFIED_CONTAM: hypothetical protein H355_007677 [Colinus virginianus]|nr:hypothetical protein H355_007677 [Colinus virginianus]